MLSHESRMLCWLAELQGFYRGYFGTIMREIPFAVIQFPLWEFFKHQVAERQGSVTAFQSSVCGAVAGKNSKPILFV